MRIRGTVSLLPGDVQLDVQMCENQWEKEFWGVSQKKTS